MSPEIENAKKCDELRCSSSVVAVKLKDSILLVAKKPQNYRLELTRHRIINKVSDNILVSACGFGIDSHHVVRKAQTESVMLTLSTELPCQTEKIMSKLSEYLHLFVSKPEYRPLGVAVIVAGQDINKTLSLFKITADGEKYEYEACCIGHNACSITKELEKCYDVNHSPSMTLKCVLRLLKECESKNVQVGQISGEQAKLLTEDEVKEMLK